MRLEFLPGDVVEAVVAFLSGFDAFSLSHATREWRLWLSDASFWQKRLHGEAAEPQGPPWMKDLKGSAKRLKQKMGTVFQREMGLQWKKKYIQERSVLFHGIGCHQFHFWRQQGSYAYLEHNVSTESREQRPMAYFTGNTSLSFDVWFCLLPDSRINDEGRCAGGVIYGLDWDGLSADRWQPILVDSKYNLYCSLLEGRIMVAANLEPNRWYHLALTYDSAKQHQIVYLGGVEVSSIIGSRRREWTRMTYQQIGTGHIVAGDGDFPYPDYKGAYDFRGLVDEFRVWNGVLLVKEIVELAHGGILPYRAVWASMKLPGRKTMGMSLKWVQCTRPAEAGVVKIVK